MGTEFLLLDDEHQKYLDCDKYFLPVECRKEMSFEDFIYIANSKYGEPPVRSNRYELSRDDAQRIYNFCVFANWTVRMVGDCWDDLGPDYFEAKKRYVCVGTLSLGGCGG
jgi:hypothetical protein